MAIERYGNSVGYCFLFIFGCGKKDFTDDLKPIKNKLEQLEKRFTEYEQQKELKELKAKFDKDKAALEEQLKRLEEKYEKKLEKIEAAKAPAQGKPAMQKPPITAAKRQYHIVTHGETLYSISRKYKVPVAELCRLNNLKPTQHVLIGQKILVPAGSKH